MVIAPFIIGVIVNKKSEAERLALVGTILPLDKALFCLGLILTVLNIDMIKNLISMVKLCGWVKEIKFDYREYIRIYGRKGLEAGIEQENADKLSEAALLLENKKEKLVYNLMYVFRFTVGVIIIIAGSCWIDNFFNQIFALRYVDIEVEWANAAFYAFAIVLGISIVVRIVYYFIYKNHIKNKKQEILSSAK